MMKLLNIFMIILVILFFFSIFQYYSSNKNAELKSYNRDNINEIINTKISNLPILNDDTNNDQFLMNAECLLKLIKKEVPEHF